MPESRRLALIRQGDRPRLNSTLGDRLAATFPELEVDDIDVLAAVRSDRVRYACVVASAAAEHAVPLARRRITRKRAIVTSSSFAAAARRSVANRVAPTTHRFAFQSQSLYPVAVEGVPHFVYTDHAHLANLGYPAFDRSDLRSARFLRREAALYDSAAMVFTRSEHVRDTIIHGYGQAADRVVVVGVGPNAETGGARATSPTNGRTWHGGRIVFVGVDWERKGGPDLVRAFECVRRTHPDARLDIVGCSPPGLADAGITIHGRRPLDEVRSLLDRSDAFCLPTLAEPFGVAFIEAMHAGLPVVGTDLGAIPDFVQPERTGHLVPPRDPAALAQALGQLLDDPERTMTMGTHAQELARSRYDWDVVMHTIRHHIDTFLAGDAEGADR